MTWKASKAKQVKQSKQSSNKQVRAKQSRSERSEAKQSTAKHCEKQLGVTCNVALLIEAKQSAKAKASENYLILVAEVVVCVVFIIVKMVA